METLGRYHNLLYTSPSAALPCLSNRLVCYNAICEWRYRQELGSESQVWRAANPFFYHNPRISLRRVWLAGDEEA